MNRTTLWLMGIGFALIGAYWIPQWMHARKYGFAVMESTIVAFHTAYNAGDTDAVRALGSDDFREKTSRADLDGYLAKARGALGKALSYTAATPRTRTNMADSVTELQVTTTFEKGTTTEGFLFRFKENRAFLHAYAVRIPSSEPSPSAAQP
jgi:hypothetical protein